MALHNIQNNSVDDFTKTPLHCLATSSQFDYFNPLELGRYVIQSGDTLYSIAKLYYGVDWIDLWQLIAQANGILGATSLPTGLVITIPSPRWRNK